MSGPTRVYQTNAERQRAYRKRKMAEGREELFVAEATAAHAYALHSAVKAACQDPAGDPLACQVYREDPIDTLRALIDHFHDQAATPASQRPWQEGATRAGSQNEG